MHTSLTHVYWLKRERERDKDVGGEDMRLTDCRFARNQSISSSCPLSVSTVVSGNCPVLSLFPWKLNKCPVRCGLRFPLFFLPFSSETVSKKKERTFLLRFLQKKAIKTSASLNKFLLLRCSCWKEKKRKRQRRFVWITWRVRGKRHEERTRRYRGHKEEKRKRERMWIKRERENSSLGWLLILFSLGDSSFFLSLSLSASFCCASLQKFITKRERKENCQKKIKSKEKRRRGERTTATQLKKCQLSVRIKWKRDGMKKKENVTFLSSSRE